MVKVRIERKPEVKVIGRKIWISGTDNELFGQFWQKSKEDGLLDMLYQLRCKRLSPVLNSMTMGISCVEKDPVDRSFYFMIAAESNECPEGHDLEEYTIPACDWAVFENQGNMPFALIEAEMHAFMEWLPTSDYIHDNAPEMELYPPCKLEEGNTLVEFWLPIKKKICDN